MKFSYPAIFIATICLMWGIPSSARTTSYTANATNSFPPVRDNYVENPRFPGGEEACMKFIADNLRYPAEAAGKGIEGRVYVQFIIDSLGNVTNSKIVRSPSPLLDGEALRLVRSMPKWIPGTMRGKPESFKYSIAITFKLDAQPKTELSEEISDDDPRMFINWEENPRFPGGDEACMKFIADNLRYPAEAEGKGIEGRVYVQFIIDSLGHVVEPRILKSPSPLLDEEALRIVRAMPVWSPRKIRGKAVHTKMSLPIMSRKQYFKTERQTKP